MEGAFGKSCSRCSDVTEQISNRYYYCYYFKFILVYWLPGDGLLV